MPAGKILSCLCLLIMLVPAPFLAQDVQVKVDAETDTIRIGVPFRVRISAEHPVGIPVIFPDTSAMTVPFEIYAIEPEDAVTTDSITLDARTYLLQSFEVEPVQQVSLPVGMVLGNDTVWITPDADSVHLLAMIQELPEKPVPLRHIGYFDLDDQIDPLELTVFLVALASALTLIGFAVRKPVLRAIYRWKCRREHGLFSRELATIASEKMPDAAFLHQAGLLVRRYIETRVHAFLPSYSSTEFIGWMKQHPEIQPDHQEFMGRILMQADLGLYAGVEPAGIEKGQVVAWVDRILAAELEHRLRNLPL